MAGLRRAALGGLTAAALAACGGAGGQDGNTSGADSAGSCTTLLSEPGQLLFAPPAGTVGPAFRITALRGEGDYDVQVNAVDAEGRYGPDARGTVHLDGTRRSGTLTTPDLRLASGDSVRYAGRWHCVSSASQAPPSERPGGPQSPR